jgi:hypothetical protein
MTGELLNKEKFSVTTRRSSDLPGVSNLKMLSFMDLALMNTSKLMKSLDGKPSTTF